MHLSWCEMEPPSATSSDSDSTVIMPDETTPGPVASTPRSPGTPRTHGFVPWFLLGVYKFFTFDESTKNWNSDRKHPPKMKGTCSLCPKTIKGNWRISTNFLRHFRVSSQLIYKDLLAM